MGKEPEQGGLVGLHQRFRHSGYLYSVDFPCMLYLLHTRRLGTFLILTYPQAHSCCLSRTFSPLKGKWYHTTCVAYTTFPFFVHPFMNIYPAFMCCLMWLMLQLTGMCQNPFEFLISILLSIFFERWDFSFLRCLHRESQSDHAKSNSHHQQIPKGSFVYTSSPTFIIYFWIVSILAGVSNFLLVILDFLKRSDIKYCIISWLI